MGRGRCGLLRRLQPNGGEVVFVDNSDKGGICNGRVAIRVNRKVSIQGSVWVEFDGIKHEVEVKELGCWMPNFLNPVVESEDGSEGHGMNDEENEDDGDLGSEEDSSNSFLHNHEAEREEGEIHMEKEERDGTTQVHNDVEGVVVEEPIDASEGTQQQHSKWGDDVDLGNAVLQELGTAIVDKATGQSADTGVRFLVGFCVERCIGFKVLKVFGKVFCRVFGRFRCGRVY